MATFFAYSSSYCAAARCSALSASPHETVETSTAANEPISAAPTPAHSARLPRLDDSLVSPLATKERYGLRFALEKTHDRFGLISKGHKHVVHTSTPTAIRSRAERASSHLAPRLRSRSSPDGWTARAR